MISLDSDEPILVFGGPYSNLRTTQAVLEQAQRLAIPADRIICTGDVVAYGSEPRETVALVRASGCHVIKGNCEESLAARLPDCGCNFEDGSACARLSKGWFPYADQMIDDDDRAWMAGLPATLMLAWAGTTIRVVHGGCRETARWVFESQSSIVDEEIALSASRITVAGHAGLPFVAERPGGVWFNPGVVGMPANDGTPDVWYGLMSFDRASGAVRLTTHRLGYDHVAAAAAMRRAGHANEYARTLITGRWPSLDILPDAERAVTGKAIAPVTREIGVAVGAGRGAGPAGPVHASRMTPPDR